MHKTKSNEYRLPTHPLKAFNRHNNKLTTEVSNLRGQLYGPIFADAADQGLAIQSHKTKRTVAFTLVNIDKRDGDIRAWEFDLCHHDDTDQPIKHVVVFND